MDGTVETDIGFFDGSIVDMMGSWSKSSSNVDDGADTGTAFRGEAVGGRTVTGVSDGVFDTDDVDGDVMVESDGANVGVDGVVVMFTATGDGVSIGIIMAAKNGAGSVTIDETGWLDNGGPTGAHIPHCKSGRTLGNRIQVV